MRLVLIAAMMFAPISAIGDDAQPWWKPQVEARPPVVIEKQVSRTKVIVKRPVVIHRTVVKRVVKKYYRRRKCVIIFFCK